MKGLRKLLLLAFISSFFLLSFVGISQSQDKELKGTKTKINTNDGIKTDKINAEVVILNKSFKIKEVTGEHDGFTIWEEVTGVPVLVCEYKNGKLSPNPLGKVLKKGSYQVFPEISQDKSKANITIVLTPFK